jgi:hypothetical protein
MCGVETEMEHKPGYVYSASGLTPVAKGLVWECSGEDQPIVPVFATVVGIEQGAVFLQAENDVAFRARFSKMETDKHGNLVKAMPFKHTAEGSIKKGSPDEWKNGTFAAHEAWDVWRQMRLST